jgi:hypothetical protein
MTDLGSHEERGWLFLRGTDPESYIAEYILVYKDKRLRRFQVVLPESGDQILDLTVW